MEIKINKLPIFLVGWAKGLKQYSDVCKCVCEEEEEEKENKQEQPNCMQTAITAVISFPFNVSERLCDSYAKQNGFDNNDFYNTESWKCLSTKRQS